MAKHGGRGRRGWKKRHVGVDRSGVIVARALTEASVDDATTGITLIEAAARSSPSSAMTLEMNTRLSRAHSRTSES